MAEGAILMAATSATFDYEGQQVWLTQGKTTVREGHPLLKGREHLFKPLVVDFDLPATPKAAPAAAKPPAPAAAPKAASPAKAKTG